MSNDEYNDEIREGVIDKIQEIYEMSKIKLQKIQCPSHGQALKDLQFDRSNGRFHFDTCCSIGHKLVEQAINKL